MKQPPPALRHLRSALQDLDAARLLRRRPQPLPEDAISFCSNDYLGLAARPAPPRAVGSGASRLVAGERSAHVDLESDLCQWLRVDAALTFTSGYAANLGALSALASPGDLIVSDALNHASIIDGARLSRAQVEVVPHLDLEATRRALAQPRTGRAWVVTESYFSMDADSPDLRALRLMCTDFDAALVVDEAHALGVLGPDGRGLCAEAGVEADVLVGTFGKALGTGGAFVAGCDELVAWLWNRARPFVFSTGLSPATAEATRSNLSDILRGPSLRGRVLAAADHLRRGLGEVGIAPIGFGHVIPWVVGDASRAVTLAAGLRDRGVHIQAIRPPSVPAGTARLRFTVTARHSEADIESALAAVRDVLQ